MRTMWLLLVCPLLSFAQLDSDTLTVFVSRNTAVQPDQVSFSVNLETPATALLDDVLAAVQGAGIKMSDLRSVSSFSPPQLVDSRTDWFFYPAFPLAKVNATIATLGQVQQNLAKSNPRWSLNYNAVGTLASPELLAAQACPLPTLVSYAQKQAQQIAAAAGVKVGSIVGLSDVPAAPVAIPVFAGRTGDFSTIQGTLGQWFVNQPVIVPPCAMSVQFKLLR